MNDAERRILALSAAALFIIAAHARCALPAGADEPAAAAANADAELTKRIRIVNHKGEPIVGATVIPWAVRSTLGHGIWGEHGNLKLAPPMIITDAQGRGQFSFPRFFDTEGKIPPRDFTCSVVHPDYAGSTYNDVPVDNDAYKEESTIEVRPGARIEITPFAAGRTFSAEHLYVRWSSTAPDKTHNNVNEQGAIQLPRLPAGMELLQVVYAPNEGEVMFSDPTKLDLEDGDHRQLRLELKPGVRVEGWLEGPVTRPIKEGRVIGEVIHADKEVEGNLSWRVAARMRFDGSFYFDAVPRGDLQVIALCPGAMAESGEPPEFVNEAARQQTAYCRPQVFKLTQDTTRIMLQMAPTADCLVHVVGPDGAPVEGARCAFAPNVGWWGNGSQIYCAPFYNEIEYLKDPDVGSRRRRHEQLFAAVTGADGTALIRNLPAKPDRLSVIHDTLAMPGDAVRPRVAVSLVAGEQVEVTVKLQAKK